MRRRGEGSKRNVLVDEAFVLRVHPYGEGDAIVSFFAAEQGKVRGVVKRIRSVSSGFAGRFEPLSRIAIKYEPGRELIRVSEARLVAAAFSVASDPRRQPFCDYLAELYEELHVDHDPSARAYRLLGKSLEALAGGASPREVVRYVEYWLLRLAGNVPDERACGSCGTSFSGASRPATVALSREGLLCPRCATGLDVLVRIPSAVVDAIGVLRSRDVLSLSGSPLGETDVRLLQPFCRALLHEAMGRELRTTAYLRRYHLDPGV